MMVVLATLDVRIGVLISFAQNGIYDSLQQLDASTFYHYLEIFGVVAASYVAETMLAYFVAQLCVIRWRVWLTERLIGDWLSGQAYQRGRFLCAPVDNPDQRIQQDIETFAADSQSLAIGAVNAVVSLFAFTIVLWQLSAPLTILSVTIPRALVIIIYFYVIVATVFAFRIGRPLIRLSFRNEGLTASFRYALVRLRENSESIAFHQGEQAERRMLASRFASVIANTWALTYRNIKFQGYNLVVAQLAVVFPFALQAPRFFSGAIRLGDIQQTATALGAVHDSLSFFRDSYDTFAAYRATLQRLVGLTRANQQARELPAAAVDELADRLEVRHLTVRLPDGQPLLTELDLTLHRGDTLLVKGASGQGKTTLLRSMAGLWPYASGTVRRPVGPAALFLAQQPYLPLGSLRHALAYPGPPAELDDAHAGEVLRLVQLPQLVARLDDTASWSATLSPGEQQRLAMARLLLAHPAIAFLDEASSALDEGLEQTLYTTLRERLPDCILVSVGHRSTLDPLHNRHLTLLPGGAWQLASPAAPDSNGWARMRTTPHRFKPCE